jgi:RNA polymerase sigma factor (sigma-70 family)
MEDVFVRDRSPSDVELVTGGRAEFGLLFDRYAAQLYRYCARRVGPDLAEDVVAETFLIAYQRRASYDGSRVRAIPWLYGIATNVVHRHRSAEARAARAVPPAPAADGTDLADRAAERIDAQSAMRPVAAALARLSRRHRDVLLLLAAGLDHEEIAAALNIRPGTVRSRLHRGRTHLRQALSHCSNEPGEQP